MSRAGLIGLGGIAATPAVALAAEAVNTYGELIDKLVSILSMGAGVLVVLAFVGYFYGISANILQFSSESGVEKRKAFFFWGIIILFVMLSVGGILRMVGRTLLTPRDAPGQQQLAPGQQRT